MGSSNSSCPLPKGTQSLHLTGTSHNALLYLSLAATAATLLSSATLITSHLRRYRAPKEQRQIIRILFAPCVFAAISLAEIADYSLAAYIDPVSELYKAFCLCALFLLYVQFAAPAASATFGDELFQAVKQAEETSSDVLWPRRAWVAVFQFPVVEVVAIVILEATTAAGTYCETSLKPKYGHIWVEVIRSLGVGVCVFAIFEFYGRMENLMKARRGFSKLLMFKLIVFVRFAQTWIFNILLEKDIVKTSSSFTYGDLAYGIPNTLMCVEMGLFSAAFWYSFSSTEYSSDSHPNTPLPLWRAVIDALNPMDLIKGVVRAFGLLLGGSNGGRDARGLANGPRTRSGKGRYQTLEGMESLSRPGNAHHSREASYDSGVQQQNLYQPPASSPSQYDNAESYLMTGTRVGRSPSPNGRAQQSRDML